LIVQGGLYRSYDFLGRAEARESEDFVSLSGNAPNRKTIKNKACK